MERYKLKKVCYTYPDQELSALENVDLTVFDGDFVLVCGPSGSGKSTLAKTIRSIVPHHHGGHLSGSVESVGSIGYVLQDPEKQMLMNTVERELAFGMENSGIAPEIMRKRVAEILTLLGMDGLRKFPSRELSAGQKQKLAIGCALGMGCESLILDEPTGQLDPVSALEIVDTLRRLNEDQGMTIFLVEQNVEMFFPVANRLLFLNGGALAYNGTPRGFLSWSEDSGDDVLSSFTLAFKNGGPRWESCPLSMKEARGLLEKKFDLKKETSERKISIPENAKEGEPALTLEKIYFSYPDGHWAFGLDRLSVQEGEILGVIGENGGGKSTLLKLMAQVVSPQKGKVSAKGSVGFLSQNPNDHFFEDSLEKEIKAVLDISGHFWDEAVDKMIKDLKMNAFLKKNPRDLSGGERQRAALATVLCLKPKILLLDEPTRGMNQGLRRELVNTLLSFSNESMAVVVISHDMDMLGDCAHRVAVVSCGTVEVVGNAKCLLSQGLFYVSQFGKLFSPYGLTVASSQEGRKWLRKGI